jgi:peptide/nickel transport system permease protein
MTIQSSARSTTNIAALQNALAQGKASRSFWQDARIRFFHDRLAVSGGAIFLFLCLMALSATWIEEYIVHFSPSAMDLANAYRSPTAEHWFGTDDYGRDYFIRTIYAGRVSLSIGFLFALISLTIGVVLGVAGGYNGGWLDDALQGLVNLVQGIPTLPLLMIIGSMVRLGWLELAILLSLLGWTGASRQVRGLTLSVKQRDYVLAARTVGASDARIMFQHILPNVFSIVLVIVGFDIASAIMVESGLSFLGFGVQPPTPTWGNQLTNSLTYISKDPWLVVFPGVAISLTVLAVFLLSDGLRDAMDPQLRK